MLVVSGWVCWLAMYTGAQERHKVDLGARAASSCNARLSENVCLPAGCILRRIHWQLPPCRLTVMLHSVADCSNMEVPQETSLLRRDLENVRGEAQRLRDLLDATRRCGSHRAALVVLPPKASCAAWRICCWKTCWASPARPVPRLFGGS